MGKTLMQMAGLLYFGIFTFGFVAAIFDDEVALLLLVIVAAEISIGVLATENGGLCFHKWRLRPANLTMVCKKCGLVRGQSDDYGVNLALHIGAKEEEKRTGKKVYFDDFESDLLGAQWRTSYE